MFDSKSLVYYHRVDMVDGEIMICPMNTNMQLFHIPKHSRKGPGDIVRNVRNFTSKNLMDSDFKSIQMSHRTEKPPAVPRLEARAPRTRFSLMKSMLLRTETL